MTRPTKTILICDDDQGMRDTLTAILKRDYRVLTVSSGEAALALLKNEDIDLILQDIRLPGISRFDVLRIVKEDYSLVECIMIAAVNAAAIPHERVESTLFGHERGSFTGAVKQQLGKFELAAGGTLFLDEIGDLRFDLQAKLLRAIQEGEIERVGGTKPIKTDFRLIAATNIDLERAVKEGRFREDLYYRINVIPIRMPPLRDRIEDLPELTRLFLDRYKSKFRKPVKGVADSALKILASYWWPGNIRELENLIERLVAVSDKEWITDEDLPLEYHFAKLDGPA